MRRMSIDSLPLRCCFRIVPISLKKNEILNETFRQYSSKQWWIIAKVSALQKVTHPVSDHVAVIAIKSLHYNTDRRNYEWWLWHIFMVTENWRQTAYVERLLPNQSVLEKMYNLAKLHSRRFDDSTCMQLLPTVTHSRDSLFSFARLAFFVFDSVFTIHSRCEFSRYSTLESLFSVEYWLYLVGRLRSSFATLRKCIWAICAIHHQPS